MDACRQNCRASNFRNHVLSRFEIVFEIVFGITLELILEIVVEIMFETMFGLNLKHVLK